MLQLIIFLFIILNSWISFASAWLVREGKYRYGVSFNLVNHSSKKQTKQKADLHFKTQRKLQFLLEKIKNFDNNSKQYRSLISQIKFLQKLSQELASYQDNSYMSYFIEYGVSDNQNIGINLSVKEEIFTDRKNFKNSSNSQEARLFYKIKLLEKDNFILSMQPKISVSNPRNCDEEFLYELSLLSASSQKIFGLSSFSENNIAIGNVGSNKSYYNFSTSEGLKFNNDIMLINFIQYTLRPKHNKVYRSTLYDQLSIAKLIKVTNAKASNIALQIGYFWDQSLSNKNYKISGITFSIWLEA